MQWNVAAETQGSVGMWDAHFRVGGAYGTELQVAQCPKTSRSIPAQCVGANMMLHVTPKANGYFENVWAWVADHDIDNAENDQVNVAAARGLLFESQGPSWLYGTGSEHALLYQYNFVNASTVLAGMIQTESAYFQGKDGIGNPGPFAGKVKYPGDPIQPSEGCVNGTIGCDESWAVVILNSTALEIDGAGL